MAVYLKAVDSQEHNQGFHCSLWVAVNGRLYENPCPCRFSDFHLLLWAASANNHGLPMGVIEKGAFQ